MTFRSITVQLLLVSLLGSCGGMLPSVGILAPDSLGGHEMDAAGLEGSYHFSFKEDGIYERVQTFPSGKKSAVKLGTWRWDRNSPKDALLVLDNATKITLRFTTRKHANATLPDNPRLFPVEFTGPRAQAGATNLPN